MSLSEKQSIRVAQKIREQLRKLRIHRLGELQGRVSTLLESMNRLQATQRKLGICAAREYRAASKKITSGLANLLRDIPPAVSTVEWAIGPCQGSIPSLREAAAELEQAEEEFENLSCSPDGQVLTVRTEPIELQGVYLGEFQIHLELPSLARLGQNAAYWIEALDPHPAASNGAVTHPHVSDQRLCAGDGYTAIKAALESGRICDFFQLVNAVLTTYSPESPFVRLDEWEGTPCYDCGYVMDPDSSYCCESCENQVCDECSSCCQSCDEIFCRGCLSDCSICDRLHCQDCLKACPECGESCCPSCLENNLCTSCRENMEVDDEEEQVQDKQVA